MITLTPSVPHHDFLAAMLARHYNLADTPTVLITTDPTTPVAQAIERVILISNDPTPPARPTLVIGDNPTPGASHARLATHHPAELLSVVDGFLRHPERFPVGATSKPLAV